MHMNKVLKHLYICFLLVFVLPVFFCGCASDKPHARIGAFFGSPTGMYFPDPNSLGKHQFNFNFNETNGMVYTCRAGFIDLGHLREAADRTAYLYSITYQNLMQNKKSFNFKVIEPSRYWVKIKYPDYWKGLSPGEKKKKARLAAINLGQYFAHRSLIWHEIITWYGFSSAGIFSEKISSFSWEDTYSDNLGTWLAAEALQTGPENFEEKMTTLIDETLEKLQVQPPKVARHAAKLIEGTWYTGAMYFFVEMKRLNFDVGYDDGKVTPLLVSGACPETEPLSQKVVNLKTIHNMGFEMRVEIEPKIFQKDQIYSALNIDKNSRIIPDQHFPEIIQKIKKSRDETLAMLCEKFYGNKKNLK